VTANITLANHTDARAQETGAPIQASQLTSGICRPRREREQMRLLGLSNELPAAVAPPSSRSGLAKIREELDKVHRHWRHNRRVLLTRYVHQGSEIAQLHGLGLFGEDHACLHQAIGGL
jgi:hypothetical protein